MKFGSWDLNAKSSIGKNFQDNKHFLVGCSLAILKNKNLNETDLNAEFYFTYRIKIV